MTPRDPIRTDPVTWDGIEIMMTERIVEYDGRVILPREKAISHSQREEHADNQRWLRRLEKSISELKEIIDGWKWPIKVIMGMLSAILLGVAALVFDFIKWGVENNWHWK